MRYFTLTNNSGEKLDITTKNIFFTEVSGLGFEEETSFRNVGLTWWINYATYSQKPVSGKIIFTNYNETNPYDHYSRFARFIRKEPLILAYYPKGLDDSAYYRRVKVTKLTKSDLNIYGALEEDIDFTPYTPWYSVLNRQNSISDDYYAGEWIWGDDGSVPDVVFPPTPEGFTPTMFGADNNYWVSADIISCEESPSKLIIYGPVTNPRWTHYLDGKTMAVGGFTENVEIGEDEALIVDNTEEIYQIKVYSVDENDPDRMSLGALKRDLYQIRNFDTQCFVTLRAGSNRIVVTSSGGEPVKLHLEGHIYNATV